MMRNIVYYVASSLDGFIAGNNGDINGFIFSGDGVDKYSSDLLHFDTVIMGKNTYEFGYRYGLKPGEPAYAHMKHYIFSESMQLENPHPSVMVKKMALEEIDHIQQQDGTDIYLCGGGQLAGWLLNHRKIHTLKVKLNPLILGSGIKLFGESQVSCGLKRIDSVSYENGMQIITYHIQY